MHLLSRSLTIHFLLLLCSWCLHFALCTRSVSYSTRTIPHSGLAVHPTPDEGGDRDSVFNMAESAAPEDSGQVRRTITMVRV
jgi:hypothetical protein